MRTMKLKKFNEELKQSVKFNISNLSERIDVSEFIVESHYKKTNHIKTFAFSAMSIVMVMVFSFYLYLRVAPVTTLTIDFNPSLEIQLNAFDRVVDVVAINEDGEEFLEELSLKNKSLDDAMDLIYEQGIEDGYFTSNNAFLLIGVIGRDYESEEQINERINRNTSMTTLTIMEHLENVISITPESSAQGSALESDYQTITTTTAINSTTAAYYTTVVGGDVTNDAETPSTDNNRNYSFNPEDVDQLLNDLNISQTKLAVVMEVFNSSGYTLYSELEYLANLDIATLITMYNNIQ